MDLIFVSISNTAREREDGTIISLSSLSLSLYELHNILVLPIFVSLCTTPSLSPLLPHIPLPSPVPRSRPFIHASFIGGKFFTGWLLLLGHLKAQQVRIFAVLLTYRVLRPPPPPPPLSLSLSLSPHPTLIPSSTSVGARFLWRFTTNLANCFTCIMNFGCSVLASMILVHLATWTTNKERERRQFLNELLKYLHHSVFFLRWHKERPSKNEWSLTGMCCTL